MPTPPPFRASGALEALLAKLPKVAAAATSPPAAAAAQPGLITAADVALLRRLLAWPADKLFPALDVARLAALDGGAGGGAELLAAPEVAGALADAHPTPGACVCACARVCACAFARVRGAGAGCGGTGCSVLGRRAYVGRVGADRFRCHT